mgnify:CR=1 FL=1
MKKKKKKKTLNALKSNLAKNAVTPEAQTLIDEITAILAELANDPDVEYNEADVIAKVTELAKQAGAEAAAVAGARRRGRAQPGRVPDAAAQEPSGRA